MSITMQDRFDAARQIWDLSGIAHVNAVTGRATVLEWVLYDRPLKPGTALRAAALAAEYAAKREAADAAEGRA